MVRSASRDPHNNLHFVPRQLGTKPTTGLEPVTPSLPRTCSTVLSYVGTPNLAMRLRPPPADFENKRETRFELATLSLEG